MRELFFVRNIVISLIAITLLSRSGQAKAGPPFSTDDPEPTEYQHHELYLAFQQTRTSAGTVGTLPQLEYNYGAAPNLQLGINLPFSFSQPEHGPSQYGLGDIAVSAKYRFLQETDSHPMAAIFPSVRISTGDAGKGLGSGATQVFIPIWLQKTWENWQSYGGGGYLIDRSAGAKNHWFVGWQLQKKVTPQLILGGEIFHNTEAIPGEGSSSGFNLGGFFNFNEGHHLLLSVGRGLTNVRSTNEFSTYIGYQWTW